MGMAPREGRDLGRTRTHKNRIGLATKAIPRFDFCFDLIARDFKLLLGPDVRERLETFKLLLCAVSKACSGGWEDGQSMVVRGKRVCL